VGSSQMIQCTVSGMGLNLVMFSWLRPGGSTITSDSRVTITSSSLMSTLEFVYLMEGDEGTYMCNVRSESGGSGVNSTEIEALTSKYIVLCSFIPLFFFF